MWIFLQFRVLGLKLPRWNDDVGGDSTVGFSPPSCLHEGTLGGRGERPLRAYSVIWRVTEEGKEACESFWQAGFLFSWCMTKRGLDMGSKIYVDLSSL